ncbi:MAG: hypothetical protein IPK16_16495 [Anaerolineales bacterium]|nr:hypothetical protein [Anaerolineales bacterium]
MKTHSSTFVAGSLIVLLAVLFAGAALFVQTAVAQPITPFGAHPMQDHWGQAAAGAGAGTRWTSSSGTAITGITTAVSAQTGVLGRSRTGYGVYGDAVNNTVAANAGVYGVSASERRWRVRGLASSTTGQRDRRQRSVQRQTGIGVYGQGHRGVYGFSAALSGDGVMGCAAAPR